MKFNRYAATLFTTTALAAMPAMAADFTITNGQTVTTTQTIGAGANETGIVQDSGTISTTANTANAIQSNSAGGTVINNGDISTSGNSANGINSASADNELTNNGSITTGGNSAMGIRVNAVDNIITNAGTITTNGSQGYAVSVESGSSNSITNSGQIITNGSQGYAISLFGGDNSATNNGTITTADFAGLGMYSNGADNRLVNNGTITTNGLGADGMITSSPATNNVITNNGTVTTNGNSAYGLRIDADTTTLTNNGTVTTTGITATGVHLGNGGVDSDFVNNGLVSVLSTSSFGVYSDQDGATVTNHGTIRSTSAAAVYMNGSNNALILKANSNVEGDVIFNGGGTQTLTYDVADTSRAGSITRITGAIASGSPTTTIANTPTGMRAVQSGNTVAVITPDQFGGSNQIIAQTVSDASNVVNNRQQMALLGDTTEANDGAQYAASGDSASDAANPNSWAIRDRSVAWVDGLGSYQQRGQTSDTSDSSAISGGVLTGVDLPQTEDGIRAGFYVGGFAGNLEIGNFRDVDSTGAIAGGYVGRHYGEYYVSAGLDVGLSSNDSERNTGIDTASADYNSYFASPSVTVMRPVQKDGYTLVPNATIRYTAQLDDSYTESGSAVNQSVDSRVGHSLDARAMVDARFDAKQLENGGRLKPSLRAGLQAQTQLGDNETDVTVLGSNLAFDPSGDDNTVDAVFGVNLSYAECEQMDLYFDAEANAGLTHGGPSENYGAITRAGVKWKF